MVKKIRGPNPTILGAAGEHHVMSRLLRRDMIAALAPAGVPNSDIVVTDKLGDRLCAIQVKVRRDIGADGGWHMGKKHEELISPNLFYCFVDFGKSAQSEPKTWVVPSRVVAEALKIAHETWLATPGKGGRAHKDSDFRRFRPMYEGLDAYRQGWLDPYFEKWEIMETASRAIGPSI